MKVCKFSSGEVRTLIKIIDRVTYHPRKCIGFLSKQDENNLSGILKELRWQR